MRKFSFKLESVLNHRDSLVKIAQGEVEEAAAAVREAEEAIHKLRNEIQDEEEQVHRMQQGALDPTQLTQHLDYIRALQERIAVGEDGLLYLRNILSEKQRMLTEALKERKVLENLKERQLAAWKDEARRYETAELDEIATIRYVREREEFE